jgi:uncharacterized phage-associated protein
MTAIRHHIILSSSYSEGARICLDFPDCSPEDLKAAIAKISSAYDGKRVSFSVHMVHADSADWGSVIDADPYFDDVRVIDSVDEFVELIRKDCYLTGMDVAKYILSKQDCTHTRLEKLTYMCYADYLCATTERLFVDQIYAFQYGPIVDGVYQQFRGHSKVHPGFTIDDVGDDETRYSMDLRIQMRSRILFSEDGDMKMESIDRTLERYRLVRTDELVELTHTEGSPWYVARDRVKECPDSLAYTKISDEDIIKCHHVEER